MVANPYRLADARIRRARRRGQTPGERLAPLGVLVGAAVAVVLAREVYATLLAGGEAAWRVGFEAIVVRVGLATAALLSLSTYDAVVRGPDRGVLDLLPLRPGQWLAARLELVVRGTAGWLLVGAVFLVPLLPRVEAFLLGGLVLAGGWAAGIGAGLGVNLAAPGLAATPALAPLFDAVRGPNPRLQAALLYAPGVALALSGSATIVAARGAGAALDGTGAGWLALAAPFLVAALGVAAAARSAPSSAGIGAVLGEIESAWAAAAHAEDARTVYLEWSVRLVPERLRLGLRKDLRHLWRAHRGWVSGAWGLGFLAAIAAWSDAPDAPTRLARVGTAALALFGVVGVRLGANDPAWLDTLLPLPGRRPARAVAVLACMQAIMLPGVAALAVRHGLGAAALAALRLELLAALLAALAAWAGDALRNRGALVYFPAALLIWSLGGAS